MSMTIGGMIPSRLQENVTAGQTTLYSQFLVTLTNRSLNAFIEGELERFDALVRENGCHKRAIEVVSMACDPQVGKEAKRVQKTLDKSGIDTPLTEQIHYLVLSYMLTVTKEVDKETDCDRTVAHLLQHVDPKLSKRQCERFVADAQEKLAHLSVSFLKESVTDATLREQLEECNCVVASRTLAVMPCYFEAKAMLNRASSIVLIVRLLTKSDLHSEVGRLRLFYVNGKRAKEQSGPAVAIEGFSVRKEHADLEKELAGHSMHNLVLYSFASHPQFIGDQKERALSSATAREEVAQMAEQAVKLGCTLQNPSLFRVYHVYPTYV